MNYVKCVVSIHNSKNLHGLTGDHGEEWCCFIRDIKNPLNSGWKWFSTKAECQNFIKFALLRRGVESCQRNSTNC